jgi:uncharacterized small protein (DUF1192 family)
MLTALLLFAAVGTNPSKPAKPIIKPIRIQDISADERELFEVAEIERQKRLKATKSNIARTEAEIERATRYDAGRSTRLASYRKELRKLNRYERICLPSPEVGGPYAILDGQFHVTNEQTPYGVRIQVDGRVGTQVAFETKNITPNFRRRANSIRIETVGATPDYCIYVQGANASTVGGVPLKWTGKKNGNEWIYETIQIDRDSFARKQKVVAAWMKSHKTKK